MPRANDKYVIEYRLKRSDHFWQPAFPEPVDPPELSERLRKAQSQYGDGNEYRTRPVSGDCPEVSAAGFCGRPH